MEHISLGLEMLKTKVEGIQSRKVRANLIIQGIVEDKNEDFKALSTKVEIFFKEEMELPEDTIVFSDAYWKGKPSASDRAVCVKLTHPSDKALIFKNASTLKGKTNAKKQAYIIRDDQNDTQQEVRKYLSDLRQENNELEENQWKVVKLKKGQVMVNNQMVEPKVSQPDCSYLLRLNARQLQDVLAVHLIEGQEHSE